MNPLPFCNLRALTLTLFLVLPLASAQAQDKARDPGKLKQDFADSRASFASGDHARGEELILKSNRHEQGTLAWRLESAGKLTQMAFSLRQQYDHRGAITVAQRALVLLRETAKHDKTAMPRERAEAHELAAYIAEEILRDPAAAQADYEEALKINPQSRRAQAGLARLEEAKSKAARLGKKR